MVGRDRRARQGIYNARSSRTTRRFGCDQKMKFFSLQFAAASAYRTNFAERLLIAPFLIRWNSETRGMFGTRIWWY